MGNTSKENLPDNWTRWTVIVREDLLDKFKDYAYTERLTYKEALEKILSEFLADKEVLKRKR